MSMVLGMSIEIKTEIRIFSLVCSSLDFLYGMVNGGGVKCINAETHFKFYRSTNNKIATKIC